MKLFLCRMIPFIALSLVMTGCPEEKNEGADQTTGQTEGQAPGQGQGQAVALKQVAENEPNEKTDQAMEIRESSLVNATLEPAAKSKERAKDWYKIVPTTQKTVKIRVTGIPGEDLTLSFLDADKNELFDLNSQGVGEEEMFPNLNVDRGVYLQVSGSPGGKGGAYQLSVEMTDPVPGDEIEYNGKYSAANAVKVGEKIRGYLGDRRDQDWYLVSFKEVPTGSVLRVDLTGVEGVRFNLKVLDQQERAPLLETKSAETGKGVVIRNLGIPAAAEAIYLVVESAWVAGPQPKKYVQTFNPSVPYSLSISSEAGGDDLEREPNNDAAHAFQLLDGQKIRAYLSAPDDVDWFKISVERPSLLSAELSALNRVDLVLYVVNPEKKDLKDDFELLKVNDGAVNEPEVLTNCALQPGDNFVRIEGAWKNVDGKWVRDFVNLDETYTIMLNLRTDEGKEEREPNNKVAQATPIKVGESLRGTIHPKGDTDMFQLDLSSQDGPRNTVIECTGIPKVDIAIDLLGPEMDEKGNLKKIASSARGSGEAPEQISKELMPGEYHILVRGTPSNESNTRDQYVLTVTQP